MNRMRKIVTQVLVALVAFSTLFVATLSVQPKRAEALVPVTDPLNLTQNIMKILKEFGLDTVVTMVGYRIVDKLVESTRNWAEGGFDGQPSFISNWDDFWKDVQHDTFEVSFQYALNFASDKLSESYTKKSKQDEDSYNECVKNFEASYRDEPVPANEEECVFLYYNSLGKLCFTTVETMNIGGSEVSATKDNCREGQYRYPEDAGRMVKDYQREKRSSCMDARALRKEKAMKRACGSKESFGTTATHALANIAHMNYETYKSSKHLDLRKSVTIVGKYARKSLFGDDYKDAIKQEGPLKTYLDRQGTSEDEFLNDFSVGGWEAYMLQSGDNTLVKKSKIVNSLSSKVKNKIQSKLQDIQTPNKFLDKLKCKKGTDEYGNCKGGESKIITPSSQVDDQEKEVLKTDKQQALLAKELSDLFAYALGRVTEELFSYGMDRLNERLASHRSTRSSIFEKYGDLNADEYDVLGITIDGAQKSKEGTTKGKSSFSDLAASVENDDRMYSIFAGSDASVPYVGGPEDPRGSVELVVDLKKKLNKQLKITKAYLDESLKIRKILNKSVQYISVLDHCLPGPDLKWEDRYRDKVNWVVSNRFDNQDEEECSSVQDAYTEAWLGVNLTTMKEASRDPFLNIPGSDELRATIYSLTGTEANVSADQLSREISERRRVFSTLLSMRELIRERLNTIEGVMGIPFHLPLFEDEVQTLVPGVELTKIFKGLDSFKLGSIGKPPVNQGQNIQDSSDGTFSLPRFEEVVNSRKEFFGKVFGEGEEDSLPQEDKFQKYLSSLNKPTEDEQLVKIPDLSGSKGMKVKWLISDQDLIRILSLPASVLEGKGISSIPSELSNMKNFSQQQNVGRKQFGGGDPGSSLSGGVQNQVGTPGSESGSAQKSRPEYLVERLNLYFFKNGETPAQLVAQDKKKAAQLAMDLAWALWRKFTPKKEKARFRYQFHVLETNGKFVTEKQLIEKQIKSTEVANSYKRALDYASDCKTFVSYVRNRRSDREIDQFLEREYEKQKNGGNSVFITDLFTSPAHRKLSILKFGSESAVRKYYNDMYPDMRDVGRAFSIREIFVKDRTMRTLAGITPTLISSDRTGLMFAAAGLPQVAVVKALFGKPPVQIKADPNYGKELFCAATGTTYVKGRGSKTWFGSIINSAGGNDKCWDGHSIDLCSSSGNVAGQTWYYARKAVYQSAVAGVN